MTALPSYEITGQQSPYQSYVPGAWGKLAGQRHAQFETDPTYYRLKHHYNLRFDRALEKAHPSQADRWEQIGALKTDKQPEDRLAQLLHYFQALGFLPEIKIIYSNQASDSKPDVEDALGYTHDYYEGSLSSWPVTREQATDATRDKRAQRTNVLIASVIDKLEEMGGLDHHTLHRLVEILALPKNHTTLQKQVAKMSENPFMFMMMGTEPNEEVTLDEATAITLLQDGFLEKIGGLVDNYLADPEVQEDREYRALFTHMRQALDRAEARAKESTHHNVGQLDGVIHLTAFNQFFSDLLQTEQRAGVLKFLQGVLDVLQKENNLPERADAWQQHSGPVDRGEES